MGVNFETLNDFRRMARVVKRLEREVSNLHRPRQHRRRAVVNQRGVNIFTSAEIPPYGCFKFSGFTGTARRALTVAQSTATGAQHSHGFNTGITLDASNHGWAQPGPPWLALYDTADGTPVAGESWGPISGSWKLRKRVGGFAALGVETIASVGYVWVMPAPFLLGKGRLDGDLATGGSATVSVYDENGDTTYNITVFDADEAMIATGDELVAGIDIIFGWLPTHREYHLINADTCPTTA